MVRPTRSIYQLMLADNHNAHAITDFSVLPITLVWTMSVWQLLQKVTVAVACQSHPKVLWLQLLRTSIQCQLVGRPELLYQEILCSCC